MQATHIADMQLSQLTRLGRANLEEELAALRGTIAELEAILGDGERPLQASSPCQDGARGTSLANDPGAIITFDDGDMPAEDLITDERTW